MPAEREAREAGSHGQGEVPECGARTQVKDARRALAKLVPDGREHGGMTAVFSMGR
jgi:hypothetical protein